MLIDCLFVHPREAFEWRAITRHRDDPANCAEYEISLRESYNADIPQTAAVLVPSSTIPLSIVFLMKAIDNLTCITGSVERDDALLGKFRMVSTQIAWQKAPLDTISVSIMSLDGTARLWPKPAAKCRLK